MLGPHSCFCNYLGSIPSHASKTSAEKWGLLFPKQWKCQAYRPWRFSSRHTRHWAKFGLVMSNLLFRLRILQNNNVLFFYFKKWKIEGSALSLSFIKKQNTLVKRKEELQIIPKQPRPFYFPGTSLYSEAEKGRITCAPPYPVKQTGAFSCAV